MGQGLGQQQPWQQQQPYYGGSGGAFTPDAQNGGNMFQPGYRSYGGDNMSGGTATDPTMGGGGFGQQSFQPRGYDGPNMGDGSGAAPNLGGGSINPMQGGMPTAPTPWLIPRFYGGTPFGTVPGGPGGIADMSPITRQPMPPPSPTGGPGQPPVSPPYPYRPPMPSPTYRPTQWQPTPWSPPQRPPPTFNPIGGYGPSYGGGGLFSPGLGIANRG